jgi:hypothetical protein
MSFMACANPQRGGAPRPDCRHDRPQDAQGDRALHQGCRPSAHGPCRQGADGIATRTKCGRRCQTRADRSITRGRKRLATPDRLEKSEPARARAVARPRPSTGAPRLRPGSMLGSEFANPRFDLVGPSLRPKSRAMPRKAHFAALTTGGQVRYRIARAGGSNRNSTPNFADLRQS